MKILQYQRPAAGVKIIKLSSLSGCIELRPRHRSQWEEYKARKYRADNVYDQLVIKVSQLINHSQTKLGHKVITSMRYPQV